MQKVSLAIKLKELVFSCDSIYYLNLIKLSMESVFDNQISNMEQPKILVAIRKRPLSKKETSKGETDIVTVKNNDTVIVSEYKQKVDLTKFLEETIFNFDFAFNQETQNEEIYDFAVRPLVDSAFQGAKVTCFAYGQTGSGKTYTMNGNMGQGIPGLYTLGANDIFDYLASPQFRHLKAKLSFYEIYCGKLFDLLNKRNELKLREDNKNNINIIGLEEANVCSSEEFIEYLSQGSQQRVTSQNSANADSSRSHAILQISLKDGKKLHGKISFIDLAGNERGADHMDMDKQTRIDGAEINKSLLSLKQCIRALDQGKGHTPFRGSKLTMVLKDSFVGFCRTVMIGNVSPSSASSENTLNTLRYADRVKQLRKPQEASSKEDLKAKEMMLPRQNKNAIRIMINNDDDAEDIARKRDEAQKQYGLAEQAPVKKTPLQKQEPNIRKNSFGANKVNQIGGKPENKSNSISKNLVGSIGAKQPLVNNLIGQQSNKSNPVNNMTNQKPMNRMDASRNQQPTLNRYNSSQQDNEGMMRRQKEEPMDIESPSTSPYYVPSNKSIPSNPKIPPPNNTLTRNSQQTMNNFSAVMNQSQNYPGNYSQMNMSSSYAPQMQNRTMSNDQYANQSNRQPFQNPQFANNNYPSNNFQHNAFQNNFQNSFQNNNQYHFQNNNMPRAHVQHQPSYDFPENWEELVNTVTNSSDPDFNSVALSEMNKRLFHEENDLTKNHSETLRREIEIIKSEMSLLNEIEIDKSRITSREYVRLMQDSIEDKISMLEMLRERLINFTYKLDEMEEIQSQGIVSSEHHHAHDQQLLDDIN